MKTLSITAKAKVSSIKQPKELATYERDIDGNYVYESTNHSYYYFPDSYVDKAFDLTGGIAKFKKIPEDQNLGDFKTILTSLVKHEQQAGSKVDCDIITFRGIITKIMTLPIEKDSFKLKLMAYDGHILMKNNDDFELSKRLNQQQNEYQQKCEFSGYKFEKLAMLPKPWAECSRNIIESRHKLLVNNYEQFISVVRTSISGHKLVLAGEIDGVFDFLDEKDNLPHYVELKTNGLIKNPNQMDRFEHKLYKTWAQCFTMGIKKVVVGFRDEGLLLRNVEVYETDEIPVLLKDKINCMSSLKFLGAFMEWINDIDKTDYKSYDLSYEDGNLILVDSSESYKDEFLTEDFVQWRLSLSH